MPCGEIAASGDGPGSMDDFRAILAEPGGEFIERVEVEDRIDTPNGFEVAEYLSRQCPWSSTLTTSRVSSWDASSFTGAAERVHRR